MGRQHQAMVRDFDLLSASMQQRLHARVAEHHNDVTPVQHEVDTQLATLDRQGEPLEEAARGRYQAQRALLIAQRTFLTELGSIQHADAAQQNQAATPWYRLRRS